MKTRSSVPGWMLLLLTGWLSAQAVAPPTPTRRHTSFAAFGKLPLCFVENRGVYPDEVAYSIQGADKTLFFTKNGITFRLKGRDRGWVVKLEFVGANPNVHPSGEDRRQAVFSHFHGPEENWKTGLPTFARVVYADLWPGIDLVYRGGVNNLKYEFIVAPGADPSRLRLRYRGATVQATEDGGIRVETPIGSFQDEPPVACQEVDGKRVPVEVGFVLTKGAVKGDADLGFDIGVYDRTRSLVLDPAVLVYCGYIGGEDDDRGEAIAVDAAGNAYVAGYTKSTERTFPVRVGPDLTYNGGQWDAFVAKVNAGGAALVYCGYIGGGCNYLDRLGIAVDGGGNAYVAGTTTSDERSFPVKVGPDLTFNGGRSGPYASPTDVFVAKVNATGTGLVYCGYIGGKFNEGGVGIAVDASGHAYVTGSTESLEISFPVKGGPDLTHNGAQWDAFVAKVNGSGTGLVYCGFIGGTGNEGGSGIAVDASGNAYVTGWTESTETTFPVKGGPDLTFNGGRSSTTVFPNDAFVAKVSASGTGLAYCGYVGGSLNEGGAAIAVDASGCAYLTGWTESPEPSFPVKAGPDLTFNGGRWSRWEVPTDAFVAKVNGSGTGLVYCGFIGGEANEGGAGIAVDASRNAYVAGWTASTEATFPVRIGPDVTYNGNTGDGFVAKVNAAGTGLGFCGYIGGSADEWCHGLAVDAGGNAYVVGSTRSAETSFPVKVGPDLTRNDNIGVFDAFVAKVEHTLLEASGTPRPGGIVSFVLTATADVALPYQVGTALGNGPIPVDTRKLNLSPDGLLLVSTSGFWPGIFSGYRGVIDSKGQARAAIHIPNVPALIGLRLHSAFVTLSPSAPSGVESISNTFMFSIAK